MVGIDIQMPESCYKCKFKAADYCCLAVIMEITPDKLKPGETKPEWCPAIDLSVMEEKRMLTLPIKRKWFDMIRSGEKKEEYRKITPFYLIRFKNVVGILHNAEFMAAARQTRLELHGGVVLRAGYSLDSPAMLVHGTLRIGTGRKEWGAEEGEEYFIIDIMSVEMLCTDDWKQAGCPAVTS